MLVGAVVSDIESVSSRAMIEGLRDGRAPSTLIVLAKRRLKGKCEDLLLLIAPAFGRSVGPRQDHLRAAH
jgi:hypothetical protein